MKTVSSGHGKEATLRKFQQNGRLQKSRTKTTAVAKPTGMGEISQGPCLDQELHTDNEKLLREGKVVYPGRSLLNGYPTPSHQP